MNSVLLYSGAQCTLLVNEWCQLGLRSRRVYSMPGRNQDVKKEDLNN